MAARINPSKGSKPDKQMRDALRLELAGEITVPVQEGKRTVKRKYRKDRLVARAMVNNAIKGDTDAGRLIFERVDGKVPTVVQGPADPNAPGIPVDLRGLTNAQLDILIERISKTIADRA